MRRSSRTVRATVIVLGTAAVLAGCGGREPAAAPDDASSPALAASPSSAGPPATVTPEPARSDQARPDRATAPTGPAAARSADVRAEGSGCTPAPGALPDGEWYGDAVAARADALDFDLKCWFVGEAAVRAAAEDGAESPPPNDYHVRNANPTIRTVSIDPSTMVDWYPQRGDLGSVQTVAYSDWFELRAATYDLDIWLTIDGGEVVAIREQWMP